MSVAGILNKIKKIKHPHPVYLVGGIVRDLLLKRPTKDIDLVCVKAKALGQKFARQIGGSFFPLDEENQIYRVMLKDNYIVDFAEMRGITIAADLGLRDFTIDAMAQKVDENKVIIDPLGGQEDLKKKTIGAVSNDIFKDDPLRLLRAFRLSASLNFRVDKPTSRLISRQSHLIKRAAPERIREELLKILACPDSHSCWQELDKSGLLEIIIPEIREMKSTARDFYGRGGVWHHTLSGLAHLEKILPAIEKYFPKHGGQVNAHLNELITAETPRWVIVKLAYLLHDLGKPETHTREGKRSRFFGHELAGVQLANKILSRLHFSNKEIHIIKNIIANHMRPGNLSSLAEISDKAIFRYFRDLQNEGLDTLVLSLADAKTTEETVIARRKQDLYPVNFKSHSKGIREIIRRFYTHKKQIVPKKLLNGHEIMAKFHLTEGPRIGQLINTLLEAQAQKLVRTKQQAYTYLRKLILIK